MIDQMPLPGIAAFILAVGCAYIIFAISLSLLGRKFPNNPILDAWNDLLGSGSQS